MAELLAPRAPFLLQLSGVCLLFLDTVFSFLLTPLWACDFGFCLCVRTCVLWQSFPECFRLRGQQESLGRVSAVCPALAGTLVACVLGRPGTSGWDATRGRMVRLGG